MTNPPEVRWLVWTDMFGGYAWGRKRDKTFATREEAEAARQTIVWHNRPNFYIRQVQPLSSEPTTGDPTNTLDPVDSSPRTV